MELFTTKGREYNAQSGGHTSASHITRWNWECLDSDELNLSGPFFVGGLDYMDPNLSIPTSIWSATLKQGFVGCLKGNLSHSLLLIKYSLNVYNKNWKLICDSKFPVDLIINGADIDVVAYSHDQNSGNTPLYSP